MKNLINNLLMMLKERLKKILLRIKEKTRKSIGVNRFSSFQSELDDDFSKFENWRNNMWDKNRIDYLDPDIILIKQNMFIISLNSLLENYFEKIIEYVFNDYLNNNTIYSNHFYLSKSYFIESERTKISKIIKSNHNATYDGFLTMLKKILNDNEVDFKVFQNKLELSIKNEMIKVNIDFGDFKSLLGNIKEDRDSLGHNFDKLFGKNTKDYQDIYYKKLDILRKGFFIIYNALEENLNLK